jgi:16S rRNA (guanine527-N7)-methyltransferase
MKGVYPFAEIECIPAGFRVRKVHALAVPGLDAERHLVLIERA